MEICRRVLRLAQALARKWMLEQIPIVSEKRMRPVEIAHRHPMCHHAAEFVARKPDVEVKGRRLDIERGRQVLLEIERHRVIRRRTDCGGGTGKHRRRCAVYMTGGDEPNPWVPTQNGFEKFRVAQILHIHVRDACHDRRVVDEQQSRARR
jgi:hypothetical protein